MCRFSVLAVLAMVVAVFAATAATDAVAGGKKGGWDVHHWYYHHGGYGGLLCPTGYRGLGFASEPFYYQQSQYGWYGYGARHWGYYRPWGSPFWGYFGPGYSYISTPAIAYDYQPYVATSPPVVSGQPVYYGASYGTFGYSHCGRCRW